MATLPELRVIVMASTRKHRRNQAEFAQQSRDRWKTPDKDDNFPGVIAMRGCWCGLELHHDWEGKEDGTPHPR